MNCPGCHSENYPQDAYCSECGTGLAPPTVTCKCGASNSPVARFCQMCAAPLGASADARPVASTPIAGGHDSAKWPVKLESDQRPMRTIDRELSVPTQLSRPSAPRSLKLGLVIAILAAGVASYLAFYFLQVYATRTDGVIELPSASPASSPLAAPLVGENALPRGGPATPPSAPPASPLPTPRAVPPRRLKPVRVSASSMEAPHRPDLVADHDLRTYWHAGDESGTEWLAFDLGSPVRMTRLGIVTGLVDRGEDMFRANNRVKTVHIYLDGGIEVVGRLADVTSMQFIEIPHKSPTRHVRMVISSVYPGVRWHHDIIPEIEVWGYEP